MDAHDRAPIWRSEVLKSKEWDNVKTTMQGSLITTFRCNAHCNMCNIWNEPTKPAEEIDYR